MTIHRRFILVLAVFVLAGAGVVALLALLRQSPQAPLIMTPTPSAQPLATVDGESISVDFWSQQYALDQVMSRLSGKPEPTPHETLDRLINERLLLQAYAPDIEFSETVVTERIAALEMAWGVDEATLVTHLEAAGLSWQVFTQTMQRLLYTEAARTQLLGAHDLEVWLVEERAKAHVHINETVLAGILSPTRASP